MDRTTRFAAVAGALLLGGIGLGVFVMTRPERGLVGAQLKVIVARTEHRVPGDADGAIVVLATSDALALTVRLCPKEMALPASPPLALWAAPGNGAWSRVAVDTAWSADGACLTASPSAPVATVWPSVGSGVARWAIVVGEASQTLPDPQSPVPTWRKSALVFDGEVVLVPPK